MYKSEKQQSLKCNVVFCLLVVLVLMVSRFAVKMELLGERLCFIMVIHGQRLKVCIWVQRR